MVPARTGWQKIGVKRLTPKTTPTPDKAGSRATSIAQTHHSTASPASARRRATTTAGTGASASCRRWTSPIPDEDDEPAPRVRDDWRPAPLLEKCSKQRFACVPSDDVMTMPLLDKRLEVLSYALREAVECMDFTLIHQLAEKAIATRERIATEQLATSTPGLRERHEDMVIVDDAERAKVLVQFPDRVDDRTRRVLRFYGFNGSGDGITYWRHRTFRRGENMALDRARDLVERLLGDRTKLAAQLASAFTREMAQPLCA